MIFFPTEQPTQNTNLYPFSAVKTLNWTFLPILALLRTNINLWSKINVSGHKYDNIPFSAFCSEFSRFFGVFYVVAAPKHHKNSTKKYKTRCFPISWYSVKKFPKKHNFCIFSDFCWFFPSKSRIFANNQITKCPNYAKKMFFPKSPIFAFFPILFDFFRANRDFLQRTKSQNVPIMQKTNFSPQKPYFCIFSDFCRFFRTNRDFLQRNKSQNVPIMQKKSFFQSFLRKCY